MLGFNIWLLLAVHHVHAKVLPHASPGPSLQSVLASLQYAFNLFSHNSPMTENGYNEEEMKMVKETKKIWGTTDVAITATCIRVPIMRAHAESINLEFDRDVSEEEVRPPLMRLTHRLHSKLLATGLKKAIEAKRYMHIHLCQHAPTHKKLQRLVPND